MCLIFHRVLASFVALIALLVVIISPIVVGLYADVRNWNDSTDGNLRWCHDDAKMRDAAANLGLAAGCVSFVVGLVLIPFILVTVLGALFSCCRPNLVTSFLLPIPVFLLSALLFSLYACVVATTSWQFEEKKDWARPGDWIDPTTDCSNIPPKWNAALAWAVIECALFSFIMLYSVLWMLLGCCEKRDDLDEGTQMKKMPKEKQPKKEASSSDSSEDSEDESDDDMHVLREDLKGSLRRGVSEGSLEGEDMDEVEKVLQKNKVHKRKRFLKLTESDLKKMGLSAAIIAALLALIASEKNKDKEKKRRRDRGYLMVDLDDALKATFNENDPKERKDLEEVRAEFRRLRITDLDFFLNITEKEFKAMEVSASAKNKLRQKVQELKASEEV